MSTNTSTDSETTTTTIRTKTARRRLKRELHTALSNRSNTLIEAPTSLGKSYAVAATAWRNYPEITGEKPVLLFHQTRQARDEAAEVSREAGVKYTVLEGRHDACPVARGDYNDNLRLLNGKTASEWLDQKGDVENVRFSDAHRRLKSRLGGLPCSDEGDCRGAAQWSEVSRNGGEEPTLDVIHATAEFARVDWFVEDANVIFDEQPTYTESLSEGEQARLRRAVVDLLNDRSDEPMSWEGLIFSAEKGDEVWLRQYRELFSEDPSRNWLFSKGYVHASASTIGRALTNAEAVGNNRLRGVDANTIVVLDDRRSLHVHQPPNLSKARCVIGLDAHPSELLWKLNTVEDLTTKKVLSDAERRYWRTHERQLSVKQVGDATNYCTVGWKSPSVETKVVRVIEELRDHYGSEFRTAITSKALEREVMDLLRTAGVENPRTLYYNKLRSHNDFKNESVGLLVGCIDPGDEYILNMLALLGLEADSERHENGKRKFGRGFEGPDSEAALELLRSVRENNVAQAIGRYARSPDDDGDGAIVYVLTDAIPEGMVDEIVPGVVGEVTEKKREIEEYVRENSPVTTTEIADGVNSSRKHIIATLNEMEKQGIVTKSAGAGKNGANVYRYKEGSYRQPVDLGF